MEDDAFLKSIRTVLVAFEDGYALRIIHILGASLLFGTTILSSLYMLAMNHTKNMGLKDIKLIYFATRHVTMAGIFLIVPTVLPQVASGLWLIVLMQYETQDEWLILGSIISAWAGSLWIPILTLQIRMYFTVKEALKKNYPLPKIFWKMEKWSTMLTALFLLLMIVIFYCMICRF